MDWKRTFMLDFDTNTEKTDRRAHYFWTKDWASFILYSAKKY